MKTEWYNILDKQPQEGDEIYIIDKYYGQHKQVKVGVWYINEVDGEEYPQALHSNSTPTGIEHITYWSYSIAELLKDMSDEA